MATTTIAISVNTDELQRPDDRRLAMYWHLAQGNPAPFGDPSACHLAEHVGREIIRRWLAGVAPELWAHQGCHTLQAQAIRTTSEANAEGLGHA